MGTRVYRLTDKDLPENLWHLRDIFLADQRQDKESLHDYLTRKKIKCFCPKCRQQKLV